MSIFVLSIWPRKAVLIQYCPWISISTTSIVVLYLAVSEAFYLWSVQRAESGNRSISTRLDLDTPQPPQSLGD
jgi:hypothetical protein